MIVQLFFNSDGYLGGWANPKYLQLANVSLIDQDQINNAKLKNIPLLVEIPDKELSIFHASILGRDFIEILPFNANNYDLKIGNFKLKFNDTQNNNEVKKINKAHKETYKEDNHSLNEDEKMIKELFKL